MNKPDPHSLINPALKNQGLIDLVLSEISACARQVSAESLDLAQRLIEAYPRIFLAGAGRSGLCMRAFGMRLMHIGKTIYVVGETNTPAINSPDLLVLASGSGRTAGMLAIAQQACQNGAKILLFTTDAASPLAELSDYLVVIPARSFRASAMTDPLTSQPLGSLFEQALWILCDALILAIVHHQGVSAQTMLDRHANLE